MKINPYAATHDELTGLPNEFLLLDRLNQAVITSERGTCRVALLIVSLNNYKTIHQEYGQDFSDRLILKVAESLQEVLREPDTIARKENHSFAIVLPQIDSQLILTQLVRRIEKVMAEPFVVNSRNIFLNTSISQGTYPYSGSDALKLLQYVESEIIKNQQEIA